MPMTAHGLTKLLEESGELAEVCALQLAQYLGGQEPDPGLRQRVEDEAADVTAAGSFVMEKLQLAHLEVAERAEERQRELHPVAHQGLVHLMTKLGLLNQVAAKKQAYFHTDIHPDGAGSLSLRLETALVEVLAALANVSELLGLDWERLTRRAERKLALFRTWDADTSNAGQGYDAPASPAQAAVLMPHWSRTAEGTLVPPPGAVALRPGLAG